MLLSGMVKVDALKWASLHGQQWSRSVSQSVENSICVYMYEDVWMKTIRGFAWTWVNTHTHTYSRHLWSDGPKILISLLSIFSPIIVFVFVVGNQKVSHCDSYSPNFNITQILQSYSSW